MKILNPFLLRGYVSPSYFCDRAEETKAITDAMLNGRDVTLQSLRRMGKTGLLQHVSYLLKKKHNIHLIYADIYHTDNLEQFTEVLGNALVRTLAPKNNVFEWLSLLFRSINPVISYDPATGIPEVQLNHHSPKQILSTLNDIVAFLKSHKQKLVLAIDEFQQISNYPETNVEAILRTHFQHLNNVNFIYSGSIKHLLANMFTQAGRPFYQSTQLLNLGKIGEKEYSKFIRSCFKKAKKTIDEEQVKTVLDLCMHHTWYVQMMCNRLFDKSDEITPEVITHTLQDILKEFDYVYTNYRNILSPAQWKVLKAIAHEERVYNHNAADFIKKYDLNSSATVNRSLNSLLNQDMITQDIDADKRSYYRLNDVFLIRFIQQHF